MKNIILKCYQNVEIKCYLYEPSERPKGAVLIVHGMQEHAGRYMPFCEFLLSKGYAVLAPDLRGHGKTAESKSRLGYANGDIFNESVEDLKIMLAWLKKSYNNCPVYVFSHSYGSMICQKLMQVSSDAEKYVLCGTANGESFLMKFANVVTKLIGKGKEDKLAGAVENLSIKAYGKKFKNGNWFTRDDKVFDEYLQDEYCGGDFPYSFYLSLFSNIREANKGIKDIDDRTQIFLIAGTEDPVGQKGKQVKQLYKEYKKAGKNVKIKLYKDCRHELLNELNKDEVYKDILNFFEG